MILSFGGDLSENILFSLGEVLKLRMQHEETDAAVAKRVFSIFVEQAQNVIRYSADKVAPAEPPGPRPGQRRDDRGRHRGGPVLRGLRQRGRRDRGPAPARAARRDLRPGRTTNSRRSHREKLRQPPDEGSLGGSIGLIEIARRSSAPCRVRLPGSGRGAQPGVCLKAFI
ncbi:DUF6272 family protein [Methylobacterium oryzae CBMB20]